MGDTMFLTGTSLFLGQDIHLSDFPEKHPKMPTYFFQVKIGGVENRVIFFQIFLLIHPR